MEGPAFIVGAALATLIALLIIEGKDSWWRDELVRRGYAHYYIDDNFQRQWNWKEQR